MTDFLEELLALNEAEDRENVTEELLEADSVGTAPVRQKPRQEDREEQENRQESPEQTAQEKLKTETIVLEQKILSAKTEHTSAMRKLRPSSEVYETAQKKQRELSGTDSRPGALAVQLERAGRAAAPVKFSAADHVQRESIPLNKEKTVHLTDSVRQVDRAFERDARRYDCGFTLY